MRALKQLRYPEHSDITWTGNIFDNQYGEVVQLRIVAPPDTIFYLNNFIEDNNDKLYVDYTGLYELNLEGSASRLTALQFDASSLENNPKIIVDIIYKTLDEL